MTLNDYKRYYERRIQLMQSQHRTLKTFTDFLFFIKPKPWCYRVYGIIFF